MLGRIFNGSRNLIDSGPPILHEAYLDISDVHEAIHEGINLRRNLNPLSVALFMHLHGRRSANICVYIWEVLFYSWVDCNCG